MEILYVFCYSVNLVPSGAAGSTWGVGSKQQQSSSAAAADQQQSSSSGGSSNSQQQSQPLSRQLQVSGLSHHHHCVRQ